MSLDVVKQMAHGSKDGNRVLVRNLLLIAVAEHITPERHRTHRQKLEAFLQALASLCCNVFDFHPRQGFAERVRHQILSDGGTPRLSLDISFILLKRFPCAFVYVSALEQLGAFWLQHGMQPRWRSVGNSHTAFVVE